ncbi:MAG TPA: hypothetical protein DCL17_03060 [Dehalococcoidia bacterium]|nr:hypothetical protein [Dehalococcoidia bacterium]
MVIKANSAPGEVVAGFIDWYCMDYPLRLGIGDDDHRLLTGSCIYMLELCKQVPRRISRSAVAKRS